MTSLFLSGVEFLIKPRGPVPHPVDRARARVSAAPPVSADPCPAPPDAGT